MKFQDKPNSEFLPSCDLGFRSKSILPDSIRGNLSEVSVPVVEMSNSFQWSSNRIPKVIPDAFSVDCMNPKSKILK